MKTLSQYSEFSKCVIKVRKVVKCNKTLPMSKKRWCLIILSSIHDECHSLFWVKKIWHISMNNCYHIASTQQCKKTWQRIYYKFGQAVAGGTVSNVVTMLVGSQWISFRCSLGLCVLGGASIQLLPKSTWVEATIIIQKSLPSKDFTYQHSRQNNESANTTLIPSLG